MQNNVPQASEFIMTLGLNAGESSRSQRFAGMYRALVLNSGKINSTCCEVAHRNWRVLILGDL